MMNIDECWKRVFKMQRDKWLPEFGKLSYKDHINDDLESLECEWKTVISGHWDSKMGAHDFAKFTCEQLNVHFQRLYENRVHHMWNQVLQAKAKSWEGSFRNYRIYLSDLEREVERRREKIINRWCTDHQHDRKLDEYIEYRINCLFKDLLSDCEREGRLGRSVSGRIDGLDDPIGDKEGDRTASNRVPDPTIPPWERIERMEDLIRLRSKLFEGFDVDDVALLGLIHCGKYEKKVTQKGKTILDYNALSDFLHVSGSTVRRKHDELISKVILKVLELVPQDSNRRRDGSRDYEIVRLHLVAGRDFARIASEDFLDLTEEEVKAQYESVRIRLKEWFTDMIDELQALRAEIGGDTHE